MGIGRTNVIVNRGRYGIEGRQVSLLGMGDYCRCLGRRICI